MGAEFTITAQTLLVSPDALAGGFESDALLQEEDLSFVEALIDSYVAGGPARERLLLKLDGFRTALRQKDVDVARCLGSQIAAAIRGRPKPFQKLLPRVQFQLQIFDHSAAVTARARRALIPPVDLEPEIHFPGEGRYFLQIKISEGGHADIYLGVDRVTGKRVLIKIFRGDDEHYLESSKREARILFRLNHPNIPKVFYYGEDGRKDLIPYPSFSDQPRPYLVMEYAEGGDLRERLDREKYLRWEEMREIALQLCHALEAAHAKEILHRDLKPDNIVFKNAGDRKIVQLVDWHTAFDLKDPKQERKEKGRTIGTPQYMSPEQHATIKIDRRSDVYSLGVVLFELLTGSVPFGGSYAKVVAGHLSDPPPSLQSVRPELEIPPCVQDIITIALSKDPVNRYQSAAKMAQAIERCK